MTFLGVLVLESLHLSVTKNILKFSLKNIDHNPFISAVKLRIYFWTFYSILVNYVRRTRRSRPAKYAKVRYFSGVLGRFWPTPSAVSGHRQCATTTLHTITKTRE